MDMIKKARVVDYIVLQGGVPEIKKDSNGLWHIKHLYREDEPEVVTHISPEERGTVIMNGIEYEISKLWKFEGAPCERNSLIVGGKGYDRKG
jgi:hypothetical protein